MLSFCLLLSLLDYESERMQKSIITTVSDHLRGILTSFIGQDRNCPALPVCEAHDRDAFIERVRSFRSSSWFAKPCWLSPVICARYGWINVDIDLLRCVGCQSVLVVRAPSSFDPAIYNACQKRLEEQLKQAAHHPCCTWPGCPTPEVLILAHGNSSSQAAVAEDFINKALLLYSLGTYLPAIDRSALNITESDVAELSSLVRSSPKFPHDNESPAAVESAVLLTLVGWNLSDSDRALTGCTSLQCSICMRQPGLWNYISIMNSDDQICCVDDSSITDDSQLDYHTNAVPEVEDLPTANNDSPCDVIDGQHLSYEVDGVVPAAVEDLLPLVTSAKCLDLQQSLALSQSVDAISDTPDMSPTNDNETCSLAVNPDTDGNSECITDDMQGVTDTDEHDNSSVVSATTDGSLSRFLPSESMNSDVVDAEHFPGMTESVGDNETVVYDRLQETDVAEQEPGPDDISLTAETEAEQNKDNSYALEVCTEIEKTSYLQETELEAAVSDIEDTVSESADILTACDKQTHSREPCEHVTDWSTDEVTCSDNVEEDICDRNVTEDIPCASVEPACSAVNDDMNSMVEFTEEAVHEIEIMLEDESSRPQSVQKKSFDADMQER